METTYPLTSGDVVQFYDDDDESRFGCLCTFPFNDEVFGGISKQRVASLALLGAAVAIGANLGNKGLATSGQWDYLLGRYDYFLPHCIPEWIQDGILEALEIRQEEDSNDDEIEVLS